MGRAHKQQIRGASCTLRLLRSVDQLVPDNSRSVLPVQKLLLMRRQGRIGAAAQGAALRAIVDMLGQAARNGWLQHLNKLAKAGCSVHGPTLTGGVAAEHILATCLVCHEVLLDDSRNRGFVPGPGSGRRRPPSTLRQRET